MDRERPTTPRRGILAEELPETIGSEFSEETFPLENPTAVIDEIKASKGDPVKESLTQYDEFIVNAQKKVVRMEEELNLVRQKHDELLDAAHAKGPVNFEDAGLHNKKPGLLNKFMGLFEKKRERMPLDSQIEITPKMQNLLHEKIILLDSIDREKKYIHELQVNKKDIERLARAA